MSLAYAERQGLSFFAPETAAVMLGVTDGGRSRQVLVVRGPQGVGFTLHGSNPVVLSEVKPNSPAALAGLHVGALITSIDGQRCHHATHAEAIQLMQTALSTPKPLMVLQHRPTVIEALASGAPQVQMKTASDRELYARVQTENDRRLAFQRPELPATAAGPPSGSTSAIAALFAELETPGTTDGLDEDYGFGRSGAAQDTLSLLEPQRSNDYGFPPQALTDAALPVVLGCVSILKASGAGSQRRGRKCVRFAQFADIFTEPEPESSVCFQQAETLSIASPCMVRATGSNNATYTPRQPLVALGFPDLLQSSTDDYDFGDDPQENSTALASTVVTANTAIDVDEDSSSDSSDSDQPAENSSLDSPGSDQPVAFTSGMRWRFYPSSSTVAAACVPHVAWQVPAPTYAPVEYTSPSVRRSMADGRADPDHSAHSFLQLQFNTQDGPINRCSFVGAYNLDDAGCPQNPRGRTGFCGRGSLPRWGPNHTTYFLVTRWARRADGSTVSKHDKPVLQVLLEKTEPAAEGTLPSSSDEEEDFLLALNKMAAGFVSELSPASHVCTELHTQLQQLLCGSRSTLSTEVAEDDRNTDSAWVENTITHVHDSGTALHVLPSKFGDFGDNLVWRTAFKDMIVDYRARPYIEKVVIQLDAYFGYVQPMVAGTSGATSFAARTDELVTLSSMVDVPDRAPRRRSSIISDAVQVFQGVPAAPMTGHTRASGGGANDHRSLSPIVPTTTPARTEPPISSDDASIPAWKLEVLAKRRQRRLSSGGLQLLPTTAAHESLQGRTLKHKGALCWPPRDYSDRKP